MTILRLPAVAGRFYPADPDQLRREVDDLLDAVPEQAAPRPKALIVPHAGYLYSGAIAASAYAQLRHHRDTIRRVVLLGPSHQVYLQGLAKTAADAYVTPLGQVAIDAVAYAALDDLPEVSVVESAHRFEHSLEVQLPFLQRVLAEFSLVPLVVGATPPHAVADVLARVWEDQQTLLIVSTDLSHYHDYATAQRLDQVTGHAIEHLDFRAIGSKDACGCMPLSGLLCFSRAQGWQCALLDQRNSGDTAGAQDRVVGYAAYALH